MDVKFTCPICHKLLVLDESCNGRNVQCPFCNNIFTMKAMTPRQESVRGPVVKSDDGDLRHCPMCGEMIQKQAKKCRYCGEYLNVGQQHVVVSGPGGERLYSRATYNGEPPVLIKNESHVSICFLLGFFLGLSLLGVIIAYLIGGKEGLIASIKGALFALLVCMVAIILMMILAT